MTMLDRYGRPIIVGWSETEMLWVEAALSLPHFSRIAAYEDIAGMTGRPLAMIQRKATLIGQARIAREREARMASRDPNTVMTLQPFPASKLNTSPEMLAKRVGRRA